jgi:effector-binding domain-containing protein
MRSMMELFIGMDYERGLMMLKEWIETGQILSQTKIHGVRSVGPLRMAGVRKTCPRTEVGPSMKTACAEATQKFAEHHLPTDGQAISVYHKFDMKADTFDYTSGFVLPESVDSVPAALSSWSIPQTQALSVEHIGSYKHLGNGWSAAHQFARYKKLKQSKVGTYEIYHNDPKETSPAELRTEIFLPLKS